MTGYDLLHHSSQYHWALIILLMPLVFLISKGFYYRGLSQVIISLCVIPFTIYSVVIFYLVLFVKKDIMTLPLLGAVAALIASIAAEKIKKKWTPGLNGHHIIYGIGAIAFFTMICLHYIDRTVVDFMIFGTMSKFFIGSVIVILLTLFFIFRYLFKRF